MSIPLIQQYRVGRNPACADCMAHCGFEPTAVNDTFAHPLKALRVAIHGPRTEGPMAPELPIHYNDASGTPGMQVDLPLHKEPQA